MVITIQAEFLCYLFFHCWGGGGGKKLVGVKKLTLKVTNAGDLDLGDVANWGSARMIRNE